MALVTGSRQDGSWILIDYQEAEVAFGYLEYLQEKLDQILIGCFQQESLQGTVMDPLGFQRDVGRHEGRKVTVQGYSALPGCL